MNMQQALNVVDILTAVTENIELRAIINGDVIGGGIRVETWIDDQWHESDVFLRHGAMRLTIDLVEFTGWPAVKENSDPRDNWRNDAISNGRPSIEQLVHHPEKVALPAHTLADLLQLPKIVFEVLQDALNSTTFKVELTASREETAHILLVLAEEGRGITWVSLKGIFSAVNGNKKIPLSFISEELKYVFDPLVVERVASASQADTTNIELEKEVLQLISKVRTYNPSLADKIRELVRQEL